MAKLSKKEFAGMCGMTTKILSTNIIRKKVVVGDDNMIDLANDVNAAFAHKNKKSSATDTDTQVAMLAEKSNPSIVVQLPAPNEAKDGIPDYATSEKMLKYLDTLKRDEEIRKLRLQVEKMNGEVIPSAVIAPLFFQHSQSLMAAFKITLEDVVRRMGKQYGMTPADVSEMRGVIIKGINEAMIKGEEMTRNALSGILSEYQEKKGVGERN
jgi:hypothetical protein